MTAGMGQDEFAARLDAGEDAYSLLGEDRRRRAITDGERALTAAEELRDAAAGLDAILETFDVMVGLPGDVVVAEVREWLECRLRPALTRLPADWPTRPDADI